MAVDDLWFQSGKKDDDGKPVPTLRNGRGKRYRVRYTDPDGRPKTKLYEDGKKREAERYDLKVRGDVARGEYVDPMVRKTTFREYAEQWRAVQPHRHNTAINVESRLRRHAYPTLGDRPLAAIQPSELRAWVMGLPLAASSVGTHWRTVRGIFRSAMIDGILPRDPCLKVKLPEVPHARVVPLALEQIEALVEEVPQRYRALLAMVAGTGLRQGEAFGVLLTDEAGPVVDFLRRTLRVQRQFQTKPGPVVFMCPPKRSRASYRTVPFGQVVLDVLSRHMAQFPPVEVKMLDETDASRPRLRMVKVLFTDERGDPLERSGFDRDVWNPARQRAAQRLRVAAKAARDPAEAERLDALAAGLEAATMHDLRHWYASALIRAGLNVKVVAERLGHANAAMTLNVYAHLFPDDEDRSRQAIDEAFAPKQDRLRSVPQMYP